MKKSERVVYLLIFVALIIFFFDLFTLKQAFLSGDHREQQYPWAKFLQQSLHDFSFPWWTTRIHSGFPILAEGQIGAFYPLNILFLSIFPIKFAYNYIILFQYWIGGILFYLYLRRCQRTSWASFFATLIFLFGSTQGGYFYYNYISQKVVIWLPLVLILVDRLKERPNFANAFFLSVVYAVQIFGGYLQVAVYSMLYSTLYFAWFWWKGRDKEYLKFYGIACLLGIFLALPQLFPTYELSLFSRRANAPEAIAYLGSMSPLGLATLIYPSWDGFLASELYIGVLGLFFFIVSFRGRKDSKQRFFIFATVFFLLLALGKNSPLYVGLIKLTQFHSFRTPIKFLFFVSFSMAILSAYGFDRFMSATQKTLKRWFSPRFSRGFYGLGIVLLSIPALAEMVLRGFRGPLLDWFQVYVEKNIYGKPGHPYSLEFYMDKAVRFYDSVTPMISLSNRHTLIEFFFLIAGLAFVTILVRKKNRNPIWKYLCCGFLFLDLFCYGFTSIQPGKEPYDSIDQKVPPSKLVRMIQEDPQQFRIMEVYTNSSETDLYPLRPSQNMLIDVDNLGAYSPLIMGHYADYLNGWGFINDSLSAFWVDKTKVIDRLDDLSLMNVKYLISVQPLDDSRLDLLLEEEGRHLYENIGVQPRAFFVPLNTDIRRLDEIDPSDIVPVEMVEYQQQMMKMEIEITQPGTLFVSDLYYPNWKARLNGNSVALSTPAGIFRGVVLEPGKHSVEMRYDPKLAKAFTYASIGIFVGLSLFVWARSKKTAESQA